MEPATVFTWHQKPAFNGDRNSTSEALGLLSLKTLVGKHSLDLTVSNLPL
jgi:hypothetical protein